MKRFISFFTVFCLLFSISVYAEEPNVLTVDAKSAILIESESGTVLFEKNSDERLAPASITKIMSLVLIMEALEDKKLSLDTMLTCSDSAAAMGGSQIWLKEGEQMSVNDLLKAVVIVSANDATVLLAEAVAGSEESFVALMNEKAQKLGMTNTNFCNATGLDSENHYSSAYDVALMARELLKHSIITNYSTVWMDTLRNGESELVNTNKLVRFYKGCTGLKTGTTATAGYCLAASAKRDNLSLISVVMDAESSSERFSSSKKLLNYGFANYDYVKIPVKFEKEETVNIKKGVKPSVAVKPENDFSCLVKKSDASKITQSYTLKEEIAAPFEKGTQSGEVSFFLGEEKIGSLNIVTAEGCQKMSFFKAFEFIFKMLLTL